MSIRDKIASFFDWADREHATMRTSGKTSWWGITKWNIILYIIFVGGTAVLYFTCFGIG